MLTKNDILEVIVTDMNNLGVGVAKADGMVIFVRGGVTGDRCKIKLIKVLKHYAVAILVELLIPSEHRYHDGCTVHACGGCVYQNIRIDYENELKREYVRSAFRKVGLSEICVEPVRYTGAFTNYRNKVQYPLAQDSKTGKIYFGFYREKTHDVVFCERCPVLPEIFSLIAKEAVSLFEELHLTVYDEKSGTGLLRHLYLRLAETTNEIMLCIVMNGSELPGKKKIIERLLHRFPGIRSIWLNVNTENTNVILGGQYCLLYGEPYITDTVLSRKFRISPQSFYQVNRQACELLYTEAGKLLALRGGETVLDLYCGIGTIGLCIAENAKKLIGVELVAEAVENAKANAALNGYSHAEFIYCDADAFRLPRPEEIDAVIVDPPRKGLTEGIRRELAQSGIRRILYISCNPDTLARDVAFFAGSGYCAGAVVPVNMFPRTGHVECVVLLQRELL